MTCDDYDFIQSIFCPHIAVLCSDKAQEICRKNNLNFCELLKPFARLTDGKDNGLPICFMNLIMVTTIFTYFDIVCLVNFKDANGGTINVPSLQIAFSNMNSQPLPVTKERSRLYNSVNVITEPNNVTVKIGNIWNCIVI